MSKALVIFSGGQDSTTCLGWAKNRYDEVIAVAFHYGQKHNVELEQAQKIADALDIELKIFDISFYATLVNSALLRESDGDMNESHVDHEDLPASFVPNRNALFILLSHSFAQKVKADTLITGVCETDYSGYPDCREVFIETMGKALNLGSDQTIKIVTPLMYLTKAQTFQLAEKEGVLDLVVNESHTCYHGSDHMNEWGRGCGECPACQLREKGYLEYVRELK